MAAKLAQTDLGKKVAEIFKKSQTPFSLSKKISIHLTRLTFQTEIDFVALENNLYKQAMASLATYTQR